MLSISLRGGEKVHNKGEQYERYQIRVAATSILTCRCHEGDDN